MRKIGIAIGIVVGSLVLLSVVAWLFFDVDHYRGRIQTQLQEQLNRRVTLGKVRLGLLPFRLQVQDPIIAEDSNFGAKEPFIQAKNLDVRVGLFSLLRGNVQVQSIELSRPSVELIKSKDGRWNFSTVGSRAAEAPAQADTTASTRSFTLERLSIRDGSVAITDIQEAQTRTVYDHIDLDLLNYTPGKPFSFDLSAHLPGEGAQELHLKGDGGPLSAENPLGTPVKGSLTLNQIGIQGLTKFLNTAVLSNAAGSLSGETQITNQAGGMNAVGKLKLESARFNGLDIGYPIAIDYNLAGKLAEGLLTINSATIQLGQTPLSLSGSVNTKSDPANLDVTIRSGDVSIAEIDRLASAFGTAFAPGTNVTGRVRANVHAKGSATRPALTGDIAGRDLQISGKDVPQPVTVKAIDLALSPSEIRSNEFNATSGKTNVAARFGVREYMSSSPSIDAQVRAPNASLPEIQSIAKAYGVTALEQIKGTGALNLDMRAVGPLQSLASVDVVRALNGNINLDFSPLRMDGFDAGSELSKIGGFGLTSGDQTFTELLRLTGAIVVKNGIAATDDLQAKLAIGNIAATGTADLATEALNLKLAAVFSKAFSDKIGGTHVGGYLTTALSNAAGELVIPAIVTGTFRQPKFAPDSKTFVQMQAKRLVPSFDNPAGAFSNLLGTLGTKKVKSDDEPAAEQKTSDKVKGILGGIFGGKKQ